MRSPLAIACTALAILATAVSCHIAGQRIADLTMGAALCLFLLAAILEWLACLPPEAAPGDVPTSRPVTPSATLGSRSRQPSSGAQ
ncbi:hypothetical protein PQ455_01625 [Sphingomonas naphthae]|uniref:Uncharacterized protein n=1 Tax=Sphingomonas naphthae TaxID=1813468 RepID=A0ABY7TNI6_9SPHN|nr:hypothetical protein [Sphingomonas naphthae]WCT73960.1 hypothetical protein PQ455_01625 [Sphingomonas naphthae]